MKYLLNKLLGYYYKVTFSSLNSSLTRNLLANERDVRFINSYFSSIPFIRRFIIFSFLLFFKSVMFCSNFRTFEYIIFKTKRLLAIHSGITSLVLMIHFSLENKYDFT